MAESASGRTTAEGSAGEVFKEKKGEVLASWYILIRCIVYCQIRNFGSWTLVVSLRNEKVAQKSKSSGLAKERKREGRTQSHHVGPIRALSQC